jgi:hypothetical protein
MRTSCSPTRKITWGERSILGDASQMDGGADAVAKALDAGAHCGHNSPMSDIHSANDVLVVAGLGGIWGLDVADGSLLWQHTSSTGWPIEGVPRVAPVDEGVVAVTSLRKVAWIRVTDGAILGSDEVWFNIETVVRRGPVLVVRGTEGGIACYRNGKRAWGIVGVKRDPAAMVFTHLDAWTTDAYGRPIKPAGTLACTEHGALVLGDSVWQIDRTVPH